MFPYLRFQTENCCRLILQPHHSAILRYNPARMALRSRGDTHSTGI
jgi:hypothetical protein